ncbi:unnamed protein product [Effrenium voratum]|uniref:EF-hand domain-containing protein n=1 Tax=Effrenium voratum TaxID=2562239 RepID=A0AA36J001_9DINO|nr:unnamed protein product [Effrenium voratum]CAJ1448918.1 unnamed protein product [Effrenium voratum]
MEQQALMDDQSQDFSFQTVRRLLRRLPRRPEKMQFQELRLAPDVAFAFGGCASGERPADFEACVARQVDSLHVKGLGYLCERLRQAEGDMFVCLESALPAEPRPSIGFVIAQWFIAHVSQCGVEDVYQGHLERTPGSLAETVAMLALLEFLTEGTASRVVTVKVREGGTQCLSELELQAVFGAPEAESVRGTPVMRLFEGIDAKEQLHSILRDLRPQADCARGVELLAAAAQCLAAESYGSPREEVLRRLPVDISWDGLHPSLSDPEDSSLVEQIGIELYRSGVTNLLAIFSKSAGFYGGDSKLDPVRASLTVLETCAGQEEWRLEPKPLCHAGCVMQIRNAILQSVLDVRFQRLFKGSMEDSHVRDPNNERWQEFFRTIDVTGRGKISMSEWQQALEDDCNEELRELFEFNKAPMRRLAKNVFASVHKQADSWVSMEEFCRACRMAEQRQLLWHWVYLMACHEVERADDRSQDHPFGHLIEWNRHCIELGLAQEDASFKQLKTSLSVWQLASGELKVSCHCSIPEVSRARISLAAGNLEPNIFEAEPLITQDAAEVLARKFDHRLFVKIAFNTSKSFDDNDVALFGQLARLQCHFLERIWEVLFPKYLAEADGAEKCRRLRLGIDYVKPSGSGLFLSPKGWQILKDFQRESKMPTPVESTSSAETREGQPASPRSDTPAVATPIVMETLEEILARGRGADFQSTASFGDGGGREQGVQPRSSPSTNSFAVHQPISPLSPVSQAMAKSSLKRLEVDRAGAGPMPSAKEQCKEAETLTTMPPSDRWHSTLTSPSWKPCEETLPPVPPSTERRPMNHFQDRLPPAPSSLHASAAYPEERVPSHASDRLPSSSGASERSGGSISDEEVGPLAVEFHAKLRRRASSDLVTREDRDSFRVCNMFRAALEEFQLRPWQIMFRQTTLVQREMPEEPGGWNISLALHSLRDGEDHKIKDIVMSFVRSYETHAADEDSLFGKFTLASHHFKTGKDEPYQQLEWWPTEASTQELDTMGLSALMQEYSRWCRAVLAGPQQKGKPYQFHVLKRIDGITRSLPNESIALAKHGVDLQVLLDFSRLLLQVVRFHVKAPKLDAKSYFLGQDWQAEEMRYALRILAFVLSWEPWKSRKPERVQAPYNEDTRGADASQISPSDIKEHLVQSSDVLLEAIGIYKSVLVSLEESDLARGLYKPCNALQSLQAALLGLEFSSVTIPAWLAGADVLDSLGQLLQWSRHYSKAHGQAVALLFPQTAHMVCEAFSAKHRLPLHEDVICNKVFKLMRAIVKWSDINGPSTELGWSKSLDESIRRHSLPKLVQIIDTVKLPQTLAADLLGRLREWTRYDITHLLERSEVPNACREASREAEIGRRTLLTN